MNHEQLCERARRWLSGSRRCEPVFSNCASCEEIPDAIGWASAHKWAGSHVVECKVSVQDFYADKRKRVIWRPKNETRPMWAGWFSRNQPPDPENYNEVKLPRMGDYRWFMCRSGVISLERLLLNAPDHGLLYVEGRRVIVAHPAPKRTDVDKDSEIRFLRFAIINRKKEFKPAEMPPDDPQMNLATPSS